MIRPRAVAVLTRAGDGRVGDDELVVVEIDGVVGEAADSDVIDQLAVGL